MTKLSEYAAGIVREAKEIVWPFGDRNDPQGADISNLWPVLLIFSAVLPLSMPISQLFYALIIVISIYMFLKHRPGYIACGVEIAFPFLVMAYLLASLLSPEPITSIAIMEKVVPFFLLFLLPNLRLTPQSKQRLLAIWLLMTLIHSCVVVGQYLAGQSRPGGTFGYMFFGHFVYIPLSVCLCLLWSDISNGQRKLAAVTLLAGSIALFATMTRGAWLAFLAGMGAFLVIKKKWTIIISGSVLLVVTTGVIANRFPDSKPAQLIQSITHPLDTSNRRVVTSNVSRIRMWQAAINMFKDRPVFGVGPWRFREEVRNYVPDPDTSANIDHDHAHNIYFDALGTMGIVGFTALLYFLGSIFYVLIRQYRLAPDGFEKTLLLASLIIMICFCIGGLTEQCFHRAQSTLNLSFIVGLTLGGKNQAGSEAKN